jgi:serine/threonine protein kinase
VRNLYAVSIPFNPFVIRDLKLDNVLLDLSGHIRITDFNCAALYNGRGHTSRSGTPIYMGMMGAARGRIDC